MFPNGPQAFRVHVAHFNLESKTTPCPLEAGSRRFGRETYQSIDDAYLVKRRFLSLLNAMTPDEEIFLPETSLESLVAQLAEEVKHLRARELPTADESGFLDQDSFRRFENLLRLALEKAHASPSQREALKVSNSWPELHELHLLLLELLTVFFEAYRTLAYRVSDQRQFIHKEVADLRRCVLDAHIRQEEKIARLVERIDKEIH